MKLHYLLFNTTVKCGIFPPGMLTSISQSEAFLEHSNLKQPSHLHLLSSIQFSNIIHHYTQSCVIYSLVVCPTLRLRIQTTYNQGLCQESTNAGHMEGVQWMNECGIHYWAGPLFNNKSKYINMVFCLCIHARLYKSILSVKKTKVIKPFNYISWNEKRKSTLIPSSLWNQKKFWVTYIAFRYKILAK